VTDEGEQARANFGQLSEALNEGRGIVAFGVHDDAVDGVRGQGFVDAREGEIFDVMAAAGEREGQFTQLS
jgi:hypothetical protein